MIREKKERTTHWLSQTTKQPFRLQILPTGTITKTGLLANSE